MSALIKIAAGVIVVMGVCDSLHAQEVYSPRWVVSVGGGFVLRTGSISSPGGHLRLARVFQPAAGFLLEPGVTGHVYARSDQTVDVCPPGGCPLPRPDGVTLFGAELGATYRKPGTTSFAQPVASVGLYHSSSLGTSLGRAGASVGLLIPFSRSGPGPGLDVRYFRMFGEPRFKSLIPISLRWSF